MLDYLAEIETVTECSVGRQEWHERTGFGRIGIRDITVLRGDEVIAEFRSRSRSLKDVKETR